MSSFQVRDYSTYSRNTRHGCSKAQACLKKILHIISSIQPPSLNESNRGFDIDLNQCLSESGELSACSYVGKEIESDLSEEGREVKRNGKEMEGIEEKTNEGSSSDITNLQETEAGQESKMSKDEYDEDGVQTGPFRGKEQSGGSNDCLALLIAAAELISSTESESPSRDKELTQSHHLDNEKKALNDTLITESTTRESKRDRNRWTMDSEDTSPVVKSKRGRNQVLPYRFRDSVLLLAPCKRRQKRS